MRSNSNTKQKQKSQREKIGGVKVKKALIGDCEAST